jgi:hypothetical protein
MHQFQPATPFPTQPAHWLDRNLRVVAPGALGAKMESPFSYVQMYIQFSSKFAKKCGSTSHIASSCSHVASSGL